jgi:hypothetical protein
MYPGCDTPLVFAATASDLTRAGRLQAGRIDYQDGAARLRTLVVGMPLSQALAASGERNDDPGSNCVY